jgi:hypothetical protein
MTTRDLFRLIIKIFGLYFVISMIFSGIPSNISYVFREVEVTGILWLVISLIVTFFIFIFLIYKPDKLITWLKLDKGFDDDRIEFQNFNDTNILKLALIIIGGLLLLKNIPGFLSQTLFAFKSSLGNEFDRTTIKFGSLRDYINWGTSFINILIGYLIVRNYNYLSRLFLNMTDKGK